MPNQIQLDEVRTLLLSLLLARKGGTPVPVLERDYYEEEKKRIPYHRFGYTNLVEFLQSMPEHFRVEQSNGGHYVYGIASEKSKHVHSLVARQKINQKTKFSSSSQPSHSAFHRRSQHLKSLRIKIAPDKLYLLMEYIKNNPSGVSLQNAVLYIEQLVPVISISTQELRMQLRELSHQLFVDGNMIYPIQSNDIHNVTYQQPLMEVPQSCNKLLNDSESLPTTQTVYAAGQEEDFDGIEYYSDENNFVPIDRTNNQRRTETGEQFATNFAQYANCAQSDMFNYNKNDDMEVNEDFAMMNNKGSMEKTAEYERTLNLNKMINDRTKSRLKTLIKKYPDGISCAELPNIYLQEYKARLGYTDMGFPSVLEFTSYLPEIFYIAQTGTDDFMLYSADKRPIVPKTEPIGTTKTSYNRYEDEQIQYSNNDDKFAPIPSDISPTITKGFAPNDVMNYDDKLEKILVTELHRHRRYLEVYVVEVFHPNFFWIHLRENKKRFNKMMDDLSDFYECNRSKYTIAKVALKKDMNCACVYSGRWHRGVIRNVKPDFRVTVFFSDYGTLKTYDPETVYYLHKQFSFLPAQAIPCGLNNIKPIVGDRWKKSVVDKFIDKVADTLLAATIVSTDSEHNSIMVILSDTSEEEDVHINDWLVKENLAQVGKSADAVEVANMMKYVVNTMNQLPSYCFAEENLIPDSCCKATSIEEKYEVPLVSPGPTLLHYDNYYQQQPMKPPPGFLSLGEQRVSPSLSTTNFNSYSFANASNAKIFNDAEVTTNPFLDDQQVPNIPNIPNSPDIHKQLYISVWNENKKLQTSVTDTLYDLLDRSSLALKNQIHLNKILKIIDKALLEQKDDRSTVEKTPSTSNPENGTTLNDVGSVQKMPHDLNNETFVKQKADLNPNADSFLTSNPFGVNSDGTPQSNAAFSYSSDGFTCKTSWSQSDELNPLVQMSPSTASPAPSTFINRVSPANTFFLNTNQNSENVPVIPISPTIPMNTSISNNFSEFLDNVNTKFTSMLKDTNPFKFPMTNGNQIPEKQTERTYYNYDANIASYLSAQNPQSHEETETVNIHTRDNGFTPTGHVSENYTPKIVYESGPVMYNTQKKQVDIDTRQNICSNNLDNTQNTQSLELRQDQKPISQRANDFATSYTQHKVINQITTDNKSDNSQVDKNYIRSSTQGSQSIINDKPTYHQQNGNNANNLRPSLSQFSNKIEIPKYWVNSNFQNSISLLNHSENGAFNTPTTLSHQDWNYNNINKSTREMNEITDLNNILKFKDNHDKKRPMDIYKNSFENGSIQQKNTALNMFIFEKIDSVKGVTFIFNVEEDGWMLTCEFIQTFTNLKLQSRLLATLEAMNIKIVFKEIQRSEYPIQFSYLDSFPLNVPRDSEKRITSINLISLQSALGLLHKLKIVSREEIEKAFKKNEFLDGSILPTLWADHWLLKDREELNEKACQSHYTRTDILTLK